MEYLLYGANGYTAQLIIKKSVELGLKPVLAGRNKEKILKLSEKYKLSYRVFDLSDENLLIEELKNHKLLLNAAGPFNKTALPLAKACIKSKTHYIDITGEIGVFETLKSLDEEAKKAEVMLMPGVGFDVVPSDCLANYLKEKLPDAHTLELAFTSLKGGLSHGTASTMLDQLGSSSVSRIDGKLVKVDLAHKSKKVDFKDFSLTMATIPWGDISTAYTSTQIPNIEVYTAIPKKALKIMKFQKWYNPILRTSIVKSLGQKWIDKNIYGPSEEKNMEGRSFLHAIVKNETKSVSAMLTCAEGYLLTALCSINITQKILNNELVTGYQTPAMAYGWKLILEIEGSEIID